MSDSRDSVHGDESPRSSAEAPHPSVLDQLAGAAPAARRPVVIPECDEDDPATAAPSPEGPGTRNHRFRIVNEIARGGVGIVYKAHDEDLGRSVAMKVLQPEFANRSEVLARFVEEAQIGGQLQHPGIVPVYEMGLADDGLPFFAMKLIRGRTLADVLADRDDPTTDRRRILGIVEQVCQTVAYAHARSVIHRDLKPANVLVGSYGEVQVADWGFAKVLSSTSGTASERSGVSESELFSRIATRRDDPDSDQLSTAGSVFGTPAYMPPEQALGEIDRLDARSDVFSLGAILCEVLTCLPAYPGERALLRAARADLADARARLERCGADPELVALARDCLQAEPDDRPQDAGVVAQRLATFLTDVEERARQAEIRAASARVRTRFTSALAGLILLGSVGGAGAWVELDRREATRIQGIRDRFDEAVDEARSFAIEARTRDGYDADVWQRALDAAGRAIARAEELPPETSQTARTSTRRLREDLERDRAAAERSAALAESERNAREATIALEAARKARIERLRAELVALRVPPDESPTAADFEVREAARMDRDYAVAFRDWLEGDELLDLEVDAAVRRLSDPDVRVEAALALDHWALQKLQLGVGEEEDARAVARLREIAGRVDEAETPSGNRRAKLRALLVAEGEPQKQLPALVDELLDDPAGLDESTALLAGDACWALNLDRDAERLWKRGVLEHPSSFALCFRLALAAESRATAADNEEAARRYETAHALHPTLIEVRHRQGLALERAGRLEDAQVVFDELSRRFPNDPHWHRHVADILLDRGEFDAALARGQRAAELAPEGEAEARTLGKIHGARGENEEALAEYRRAAELRPDEARTHYNIGSALLALNDPAGAEAAYRRSVALDPSMAGSWYGLGMALGAQNDLEGAIEAYAKAVEADPGEARSHTNSAVLLSRLGREEASETSYRKALEADPNQPEALYGLAGRLVLTQRAEEAIPLLERAMELRPQTVGIRQNLALALAELGRFDEALAQLAIALRAAPGTVSFLETRGSVLLQADRLQEAEAAYTEALEQAPDSGISLRNLGELAERTGRLRLASRRFREAATAFSQHQDAFSRYWGEQSQQDAARLDDLLDQRDRVLPILSGSRDATDAEEWFEAVEAAYVFGEHQVAVETAVRALRAAPAAFDDDDRPLRLLGASSAALAIADSNLDAEAPSLRRHAYEWLRHEVDRWRDIADDGTDAASAAQERLAALLDDTDFKSLRDDVQNLPRAERANWLVLWSDVRRAISRRNPR